MSSDAHTQPAPRARAVATAPVEPLLARTDELARRWAIALILALPLERIGEIPLESFAQEAPGLCAHVLRALTSDEELERLARRVGAGSSSPARRLAEMTGARDGKAAVEAVEALRGVLWEALLDELRWNSFDQSVPARMVADLADRLAYVCSSALVSSLTEPLSAPQRAERLAAPQPRAAEIVSAASAAVAPAAARVQRASIGNGVVIIDEAEPPPRRGSPLAESSQPPAERRGGASSAQGPAARRPRGRALPWDTPLERPEARD
jgi:hypothetical protein